jgi:3'(2'), 5'-bisphosphate nucleotidase
MIDLLKDICRGCGDLLLNLPQKTSSEGEWEGSQFKATADKLAHDFITKELRKHFSLPILSEESDERVANQEESYFIIDPIDGTASFCHGFSGWVTQIAFVEKGSPICAVVFAPALDEIFYAEKGKGAYCNGRKLDCSASGQNHKPASIIDNYPEPRGITKELIQDLSIPSYVESGSIGLKICRIADSTADLFFKNMTPKDWDLAAPDIILSEAGGILLDQQGDAISYGKGDLHHNGLIATPSKEIARTVSTWAKSKILEE